MSHRPSPSIEALGWPKELVMKIMKMAEVRRDPLVNPLFTSEDVTHQAIVTESRDLSVGIVNFGRGVRNKFHAHDGDQVLIIIAGKGIVATENEEREVAPGEVVFFPAGEKHWHGAVPDSVFSHIVVTRAGVKLTQLEE
jgi:quercetin dioxygenase-like cupin family protein